MDTGKTKEGVIGLSYPMLNRENYTAWSIKMRVYMQDEGVHASARSMVCCGEYR